VFKVVYHGMLASRLGIDLTIQAIAKLIHEIPGLEFHIYGAGDDQNNFKQLAAELGLEQKVYFYGRRPFEEFVMLLADKDIGVVANRRSPATELMLPVKMLEYIILEIPVIVPRLPAIEYYFSEDMVTFFEPDNVDALASAIVTLYRQRTRAAEQVQRANKFLGRYGWERQQYDLINLYKELSEE
jgi:glycosyltransferase involved in cell wall biosynthesis